MQEDNETKPDEGMNPIIVGHILIRDVDTGQVLVNQRDTTAQQETIQKGNA